jgi:hypothetical protein
MESVRCPAAGHVWQTVGKVAAALPAGSPDMATLDKVTV